MADAASRYDYKKLANLGLQVSHPRPSQLRQKLHSFFTTPSLQAHGEGMVKSSEHMSPSVNNIITLPIRPPLKRYHTGLLKSCHPSNLQLQNLISAHSSLSISKLECQLPHSKTHASTLSFEEDNDCMENVPRQYGIPSLPTSFSTWSTKSGTTKKESMSKQPSVWVLPPSYDLENLHGILGPQTPIASFSPAITLPSIPLQ